MNNITSSLIQEVAKINKTGNVKATKLLNEVLHFENVSKFYLLNNCKNEHDFINNVLQKLELNIEFDKSDLDNIPQSGSFITISNIPYKGMEGIILLKEIGALRPDFKIIANYFLKKLEPLNNLFISIDHNYNKLKNYIYYLIL